MRVKGDNGLTFEVPDAVATSMIDAGYIHEVTGHAADDPNTTETGPGDGDGDGEQSTDPDAGGAGDGDGEQNTDPDAGGAGDKPKKRRGSGD